MRITKEERNLLIVFLIRTKSSSAKNTNVNRYEFGFLYLVDTKHTIKNYTVTHVQPERVVSYNNKSNTFMKSPSINKKKSTVKKDSVITLAPKSSAKTEYDLIELAQAEENRILLATIVESSSDAIVSKSLEGIIKTWNKGAELIFGYTAQEAVGKHISLLIPTELIKEEEMILGKIKRGEVLQHYETIRLAKNGIRLNISVTVSPLRDKEGKIIGASKIARDVTDIKQADLVLKKSEENFRQLADLMPEKVTTTDAEGNVIYYNKNWLDYTGLSFEELKGWKWESTMHPDDMRINIPLWKHAIENGIPLETEERIKNKTGEYRWHLSRVAPVKDDDGKITKWISATTEIQKIKEEEQRKDDFLKMVSHELKTPVTSITGYVQLLLHILKEEQNPSFAFMETPLVRIDSQVARLGKLIAEMLDLSRLNSGKLEMEKEIFNLEELISETILDIGFTNNTHSIHFTGDKTVKVFGDRNRIGQVIINLVNNAIKYSPEDDRIEISMSPSGKDKIAVTVTDHGIGIDKVHQQKIFERFYRVGGESEKNYSGFGIGLFITAEIIERHGGNISVESEKNKGASFTFTLPLAFEKNH
jgi:PAS domain S-box-containing protein